MEEIRDSFNLDSHTDDDSERWPRTCPVSVLSDPVVSSLSEVGPMESQKELCYDLRHYVVTALGALELALDDQDVPPPDQQRKLFKMALENTRHAMDTVETLFQSLCADSSQPERKPN